MEERREMNGQRMMTREELEMRLPALNHIAEQRDAKFRLRYAEKTLNNGIERGYTLDAGTRVSVNVYQNESWAQMPDEELFDTLNDLDGKYCVTEDQETIGERLNALFQERRAVRENLSSCRIRKQYGKLCEGRYHIRSISRHADYISRRTDADE